MFKSSLLSHVGGGALLVALALPLATAFADDATTNVGQVKVTGTGADAIAEPGAGFMVPDDGTKARSTTTKAALDVMTPMTNVYKGLNLQPGVNASSWDPYGSSGGAISIRGSQATELGMTVEGVPVNDSGNYAIYPQEYVDSPNVQQYFVSQGSADNSAPHVAAGGGNMGITLIDPSDTRGATINQSNGMFNFNDSFIRLNSGILPGGGKFFVSYSYTQMDKWRGSGTQDHEHVDFKFTQPVAKQSSITGAIMFNQQLDFYNYATLTKAQWQTSAYTDNTVTWTPGTTSFYKLSQNPFQNVIAEVTGRFQLTDALRYTVEPYMWYGYGEGGPSGKFLNLSTAVKETNNIGYLNPTVTGKDSGFANVKQVYFAPSITRTYRPGIENQVTYQLDNQQLSGGLWFEQAHHYQTKPIISVDQTTGTPADVWGDTGLIVSPTTGNPLQYRNLATINTAAEVYAGDDIRLMNDKLKVSVGVRTPYLHRDLTNAANNQLLPNLPLHSVRTYADVLPSAGVNYELDPVNSVFADVAKNFRAPENYSLYDSVGNGTQAPESSFTYELGYRRQDDGSLLQAVGFFNQYYDRQFQIADAASGNTLDTNLGSVYVAGLELQAGAKIATNWSVFASATVQKSQIQGNVTYDALTTLPTKGKSWVDTPNYMGAAAIQYSNGGFFAGTDVKYTGPRFSTAVNDEKIGPSTVVNVNMGYRFGDFQFAKNLVARVNANNIFMDNYLVTAYDGTGGPTLNARTVGDLAGNTPTYYVGAPLSVVFTVSADF